jgi:SAM-dependent methyltransferase
MDFLTKRKAENECGPANALSPSEIKNMLDLARITRKDVFYDLGSGNGRIVRTIVSKTKAKYVCGIEKDVTRFCNSVKFAREILSRQQLKKIDFWCADYENYDFSDATVIYNGLTEEAEEIKTYEKVFRQKNVKIIKMDLPLVSYKPIAYKFCRNIRLYLMQYPLKPHKMNNKNAWASYVLNYKDATIYDVYKYFHRMLKKRRFSEYDIRGFDRELKSLVAKRFSN